MSRFWLTPKMVKMFEADDPEATQRARQPPWGSVLDAPASYASDGLGEMTIKRARVDHNQGKVG